MSDVLEVEDLSVRIALPSGRSVQAVDGVSLTVATGETLAVVGESGCGKTMLAMAILGLLPSGGEITSGRVQLQAEDLRAASPQRLNEIRGDRIGTVFQEPMAALNPVLTVGRQVGEVLGRHTSLSGAAERARVLELLAKVGIPDPGRRIDQYPHELSGGMAQRVVIAMAIACGPALLLADEPTTALDVTVQAGILRILDELRRDLDMGVVLITHDLGVVADVADRVMVMYAGRVVEHGDVYRIFAEPQHPYTRGLLGAVRDPTTVRPRQAMTEIPGVVPTMLAPATSCSFAPRCGRADDTCHARLPELVSLDRGGAERAGDERPVASRRGAVACFHPGPTVDAA